MSNHFLASLRGFRTASTSALTVGLFGLVWLVILTSVGYGQTRRKPKTKIPAPENVDLLAEGFPIKATYYGGTLKKKAVPFIMLHGFEGNRRQYSALATFLQKEGHAVIVPDLRGHGDSTGPDGTATVDRMKTSDFKNMVYDVEACKSFLKEKNNDGELNIEMLTVVGADMGGALALVWTLRDWSWPNVGVIRQGKDVKALILLSPERSYRGINSNLALRYPVIRDKLSVLMAVGSKSRKSLSEAKRLYNSLKSRRKTEFKNPQEVHEHQDLFLFEYPVEYQGCALVARQSDLYSKIQTFVKWRLTDKDYSWSDRTNPLTSN